MPAESIVVEKGPNEPEHERRAGDRHTQKSQYTLAAIRRSALEGAEGEVRAHHARSARSVKNEQVLVGHPEDDRNEDTPPTRALVISSSEVNLRAM